MEEKRYKVNKARLLEEARSPVWSKDYQNELLGTAKSIVENKLYSKEEIIGFSDMFRLSPCDFTFGLIDDSNDEIKKEEESYDERWIVSGGKIDMVNHPPHYEGNIECIDAMQEVIGHNGVINFCIGNAFKYIWRCTKKHDTPAEDLKKAEWYIKKALSLLETHEEE